MPIKCNSCDVYVELRPDGNYYDGAGRHSCFVLKIPTLLPMNGRIVVEAISEEKTPSGLYLPSGAAEQRATIGKVIALPLGWSRPSEVEGIVIQEGLYEGPLEVGDVVLFGQNSGMLIDLGHGAARRKAIILRESEVLCKVTNPDGSPYA